MNFHKLIRDFNQYASKVHVPCQESLLKFQSWCPPHEGWVKINFDAHVGVGLYRGLGVVIRDDNGKLLIAGVRRVNSNWSVEMCEAATAMFGVELAVRFRYRYVQLEGDSLTVVRAIENRVEGFSPIHLIYDDIFYLCTSFLDFGCSFVSRNDNTLAHLVAKWDSGAANEKICMDSFPKTF
ncbi:uncharacterized protein LOC130817471 [Amaranthus tricolor]|uniref:uncharacterized protein LOC130817471 n=1 Tax=Amaranthus tricolor TaxID=29722 RepID=UPI0025902C49|nr:uncharacterized protein LOC130817471 [Amaranthus tricolor]